MLKKILITATAILSVICYSTTAAFAAGFDVNNDDSVNVNDVTFLQNEISNFNDKTDYDLNNDGRVDVNDISTLQIEISNNDIKNIEANTKLSVTTNEYKKNVGDTVTFSITTNNAISDITYSSSDSSVAKIVSSDKNTVKVKVNKVGSATVTAKQCSKSISVKFNVEKAKCIDISEWNGDINFNKVRKAGVTCVIIRAGYGKDPNQEDNEFQKYYRQAKAAGLNVGAYWYSYATSVDAAKAEVKNCMKTIGGKEFDLPVFLDVEEYRQAILPKRTLTDIIKTFCNGMRDNGFDSGLYSAKSMLMDSAYPDEISSNYLIWLAAPNESYNKLPYFVDIHQYDWYGRVDGINDKTDLNYIYNLNY
ncbi:GH25 family lysozyme [Ruminococcus bromii]|nr:GH25 family lysozyme [Ruminococcus bromii]